MFKRFNDISLLVDCLLIEKDSKKIQNLLYYIYYENLEFHELMFPFDNYAYGQNLIIAKKIEFI